MERRNCSWRAFIRGAERLEGDVAEGVGLREHLPFLFTCVSLDRCGEGGHLIIEAGAGGVGLQGSGEVVVDLAVLG